MLMILTLLIIIVGPKGRYSDVLIVHDMAAQVVAPVDYAELEAGQEMALMFIVSIGRNRTNALKNAADIDAEPAFIFHGTFDDNRSGTLS